MHPERINMKKEKYRNLELSSATGIDINDFKMDLMQEEIELDEAVDRVGFRVLLKVYKSVSGMGFLEVVNLIEDIRGEL